MKCECASATEAHAAAYHEGSCPRFANQCKSCDGYGGIIVPTCGDGCCHERERCDECGGTGNETPDQIGVEPK